MRAAHGRGIRVITGRVLNHTSDWHPGFSVPVWRSRAPCTGITIYWSGTIEVPRS
ncbi:MAG: hypothetical protein IPQ16_15120, partial [Geobacteraceae bacterium]|nr:hypothetical protein [Geobacteraceae bacterium]